MNIKSKQRRRAETLLACNAIHGGSKNNLTPTVEGVLDALASKTKSDVLANKILNSKTSLKNAVKKECENRYKFDYSKSNENIIRSL